MKKIVENDNLGLIVFDSIKELGEKIDEELVTLYGLDKDEYTFIIPVKEIFFEDGHLKVEIKETVRNKDIFILTDVGNYSLTYNLHGLTNHTSPNDLMIQLKDAIGACDAHTRTINVVMPLLYAGRQHRRNSREALACGMNLHELDEMGTVKSIITFDAHDQGVEHAVHHFEFENFYPTNVILDNLIDDLTLDELRNIVFVAPDNGATGRRNVYLNSFNLKEIHREAGSFVKQRDYNNLVDGKYPIIAHQYCGNDKLDGYTAIISDDMISSGGSMFDCMDELKKHNVKNTYIVTTFCLFTKGIKDFDKYYKEGKFKGIYTTNLSYIPEEYKNKEWLHVCDCSKLAAKVIDHMHNDKSITPILRDKDEPIKKLKKKFNK